MSIMSKIFKKETKFKMILRLFKYMVLHPIRAYGLVFNIKKWNFHYGDHYIDICYLKYGQINLKKSEKPKVSIIIPVYNQIEYTYKCLLSIAKNTNDVDYEVIIGDDVSVDGTRILEAYVEDLTIIRNKKNLRFLRNCNNATKYAQGEYIFFLNNDTEVTKNWLSSLINLIESDDTIGIVGSKLIFPDGRLQEAGGIIYSDGTGCNYGKFDDASKPQYNYVRDVDYISGAAIMLSKKLWNEIGGFDDTFAPAYCEDSDLAFEVRKRGLRVVYQPESVVIHYEGVSNGVDVNKVTSLKHYQIVNNEKLKEKWKNELLSHPSSDINPIDIRHRDRLFNKKVVLYVDHFVPEFDKDAGSKTTYQYLKMLVKKGYTIKFLPDNFNNSKPYTKELERMGIEVLYGVEYRDTIKQWIIDNKDNIDVAYLNRPHISIKYIDFIKDNTNIKIIYYGHDLHFLREKREYEITKNKENLTNSEYWKNVELDIMKKSDQVYYPSHVEEELINSIDDSIKVKAINAYIFDNVDTNKNIDFASKNGLMFVGGFNHRPNVDAVLWFVKEIYPMITKKKDIPLYIVGSNAPKEITQLDNNSNIIVKGYVTDEELNELYNEIKLVIVPLRYGAGIKGKVIEAMSQGIPFVTTTTGAEGIDGIEKIVPVTDDAKEFADKIIELYSDDKSLSKISKEERLFISDKYNTESAWEIIKDDFDARYESLAITPDGFGSKGDEAMIKGALHLINPISVKLITQRKELWTEHYNLTNFKIGEQYSDIKNFKDTIKKEKKLFIVGADLIDGTQGLESSLCRLEAAKRMAENGGKSYIFCSFRTDVKPEIIRFIRKLPDNVEFYMRDEISYENFVNLTRKKCDYFPDLGFFSLPDVNERTTSISKELKNLKGDFNLIGLNFSETSFRSLFKDYTDENRKKYVKQVIEAVTHKVDNAYLVFICHDIRGWEGYRSDAQFNEFAVEICKELHFDNYKVLDTDIGHNELTTIIRELDTVITGRMHLSIATIKADIIPIIYTGSGKQEFSMNDKFHGMFRDRFNNDEFVTHDIKTLEKEIDRLFKDYYNCLKYVEFKKEVDKKDIIYLDELKKKIAKENKNDNNENTI